MSELEDMIKRQSNPWWKLTLQEAFDLHIELESRIAALEDILFSKGAMFDTPCFCCGYNGPNYFDEKIHGCALRHHKLTKRPWR